MAEFASDDHIDGIWIYSRNLLYYTKTSMSGGAVGYESGPTGLFKVAVEKKEDGTVSVTETQLWEGDYRMATQCGEDLVFSDPYTDKFYVLHTKTEELAGLGSAKYYQLNGDLKGILVMNIDNSIQKALLDPEKEQYVAGSGVLASGTNMNIAGDRIYYQKGYSAEVAYIE